MYARSNYIDDPSRITFPDNYDGTAFMDQSSQSINETSEPQEKVVEASFSNGGLLSSLGRIPLLAGLFNQGDENCNRGFLNFGTEEILILATAAFLFFSKNGDKESALILLLLLFVT